MSVHCIAFTDRGEELARKICEIYPGDVLRSHGSAARKNWIEDIVVRETMKMLMDDAAIEAIVSKLMELQDRENVNLPLYERQLRETETAINNLLNAIQQGILTKSTKARLEELETVRDDLENRIACEKLAKPRISAEFIDVIVGTFPPVTDRAQRHGDKFPVDQQAIVNSVEIARNVFYVFLELCPVTPVVIPRFTHEGSLIQIRHGR